MAFTANVFTPSAIGAAILAEDEILVNSRMSEFKEPIMAGQAILAHQDPTIATIGAGLGCMNASIYTLRSASTDKGSKTLDCDITAGVKAGTEKIDLTKEVLVNLEKFSIDDIKCANAVDFGKELAYMGMKAKIQLEVKLSKALVALANTGIDLPDADWFETEGTLSGSIFEVAKVNFTSDMLADLQWASQVANMYDPLILNGRNFYNNAILEVYKSQGCCTNDAILNRNTFFDVVWDPKNVDQVTGAKSTLVIDKNSILFWSSPAYSNLGMRSMILEQADTYHWVETLPRLQYFANGGFQPIYVDIRATRSCVKDAAGIPRNGWSFEYALFGAMRLNLPNATDDYGILRVDQAAGA